MPDRFLAYPATAETKGSINFELMNSMPKGAIVVNTARKEVMDEAGLAKMLEERPDFKYLTDIMPAIHAELAEKYAGRYFSTPKRWVPRPPRLISTLVSPPPSRSLISW